MDRFDLITVHGEYDTHQEMQPSPIGSWVKYNDIVDLETELMQLRNKHNKLLEFISESGLGYKKPIVLKGVFPRTPDKTHPGRIYGFNEHFKCLQTNKSWKIMNWQCVPSDVDLWNTIFNPCDFYVIEFKVESTDQTEAAVIDLRIARYDDQGGVFYYEDDGIITISPIELTRYITIRGL